MKVSSKSKRSSVSAPSKLQNPRLTNEPLPCRLGPHVLQEGPMLWFWTSEHPLGLVNLRSDGILPTVTCSGEDAGDDHWLCLSTTFPCPFVVLEQPSRSSTVLATLPQPTTNSLAVVPQSQSGYGKAKASGYDTPLPWEAFPVTQWNRPVRRGRCQEAMSTSFASSWRRFLRSSVWFQNHLILAAKKFRHISMWNMCK